MKATGSEELNRTRAGFKAYLRCEILKSFSLVSGLSSLRERRTNLCTHYHDTRSNHVLSVSREFLSTNNLCPIPKLSLGWQLESLTHNPRSMRQILNAEEARKAWPQVPHMLQLHPGYLLQEA
jgi:hypothetical protein